MAQLVEKAFSNIQLTSTIHENLNKHFLSNKNHVNSLLCNVFDKYAQALTLFFQNKEKQVARFNDAVCAGTGHKQKISNVVPGMLKLLNSRENKILVRNAVNLGLDKKKDVKRIRQRMRAV